jgi:hypothetical protein
VSIDVGPLRNDDEPNDPAIDRLDGGYEVFKATPTR